MASILRSTRGSTSVEHIVSVLVVALVGVTGLGALGVAMDTDIHGDAGSAISAGGDASVSIQRADHGYTVQVIAYNGDDQARAQAFADKLRNENGFDSFIEKNPNGYWVVRINNVGSYEEAQQIRESYSGLGLTGDAYVSEHDGTFTPNQIEFFKKLEAQQGGAPAGAASPGTTTDPAAATPGTTTDPAAAPPASTAPSTTDLPTRVVRGANAEDHGSGGEEDRGGGIFGFAKNLVSGLVEEGVSFVKGTVGLVKSIGWDFIVEDLVAGTIVNTFGLGCKIVTLGHACEGMPLNPLDSTTDSAINFVQHIPEAGHALGQVLNDLNTCVNPFNSVSGGNRGYACGASVMRGLEIYFTGKAAKIGLQKLGVIGKGAAAETGAVLETEASEAGPLADLASRSGDVADPLKSAATGSAARAAIRATTASANGAANQAGEAAAATQLFRQAGLRAAATAEGLAKKAAEVDVAARIEAGWADTRVLSTKVVETAPQRIGELRAAVEGTANPTEIQAATGKLETLLKRLEDDQAALHERHIID